MTKHFILPSILLFSVFISFGISQTKENNQDIIVNQSSTELSPSVCASPTPPSQAPPVLFKINARILHDNLNGGIVTDDYPRQSGNNLFWNLNRPGNNRSAYTFGFADGSSVTGSFATQINILNTGNPTWVGISSESEVQVFIKGSSGTPYYLNRNLSGSLNTWASDTLGGIRATIPNIGTVNSNPPPSRLSGSLPLNVPDGILGVSAGNICGITFPEYPNVQYCRVDYVTPSGQLLAVNGTPNAHTDIQGDASGSFSIKANIRQGVEPAAIIKGPIVNSRCSDKVL